MSQLQFVGTKVPSEWIQKLKQLTEETGKTQSAIVRDAIAAAIGVNQETTVNPLRSELDELKLRVQALEQLTRLSVGYPPTPPTPEPTPPIAVVTKTPSSPPIAPNHQQQSEGDLRGRAVNGKELYKALKSKGYSKGESTLEGILRLARAKQELPVDLKEFGVSADFEAAKGKGYQRWLFINS